MQFKLKDKNGNVFTPFINDKQKHVVILNDKEYEILELPDHDTDSDMMSSLIADFDADPEMKQMIEASEQAIKNGHVFSTEQVIEMIKNGEL